MPGPRLRRGSRHPHSIPGCIGVILSTITCSRTQVLLSAAVTLDGGRWVEWSTQFGHFLSVWVVCTRRIVARRRRIDSGDNFRDYSAFVVENVLVVSAVYHSNVIISCFLAGKASEAWGHSGGFGPTALFALGTRARSLTARPPPNILTSRLSSLAI